MPIPIVPYTKAQLQSRYGDAGWRERLLQISELSSMLASCVLKPEYRIPDDLNAAITLSVEGHSLQQQLVTKEKVPAKEARLFCLLDLAYVELLIDVEKFDISALRASIHRQILSGDIRFPFMHGRELYDRAADLFDSETRALTFSETTRLLDGTSKGVFQSRTLTIGPFGLVDSTQTRWLPPRRRIPLYHCAELTCRTVHHALLQPDYSSPIIEEHHKVEKVLEQISEKPSEWGEFIAEYSGIIVESHNDRSTAPLIYMIGDALSLSELRELFVELADEVTRGELRGRIDPLGLRGPGEEIAAALGQSELMQLVMLCTDEQIITALDLLVSGGKIDVPPGEVRKTVVNEGASSGTLGLTAELSRWGVRFKSRTSEVAPLRLRRLIEGLYLKDDEADTSELEWQLRGTESPTLKGRIEEFIANNDPGQVLRRLVLARRTNMIAACTAVGLDEHRSFSDDDLVDTILWKLGYHANWTDDVNAEFWANHDRMRRFVQTSGVTASVDQSAVRALASNYFVSLEGVLDDSLAFSTWALTTDHLASVLPFQYRPTIDRSSAFSALNAAEELRESGPEHLRYAETNELYALSRGFSVLAAYLESLEASASDHVRHEDEWPRFAKYSTLKSFPFKHLRSFLDLMPESRASLVSTLREVSRRLVSAGAPDVRNEWLHYRRATADVHVLAESLTEIESAVRSLEGAGLARLVYRFSGESADAWGRQYYSLRDPRGREIVIARPSRFSWAQMPGLRSPQYLVTDAVVDQPNEFLRFGVAVQSEFSTLWDNYPLRRQASSAGVSPDADAGLDGALQQDVGHRAT